MELFITVESHSIAQTTRAGNPYDRVRFDV